MSNQIIHSKQAGDFIVSINYGTVNPMSWGVWQLINNTYIRVYSYYYDSRVAGCMLTDEQYINGIISIFKENKYLSNFSIEKSNIYFLIEPSAAHFIERLEEKIKGRNNIRIEHYNRFIRKTRDEVIYDINSYLKCGAINAINLSFDTLEQYPDRMLEEIYMFINYSIEKSNIKFNIKNKERDNMYFITLKDNINTVHYVCGETSKEAIVKVAEYYNVHIKYLKKIIEHMHVSEVVELLSQYGLKVSTIINAVNVSTEVGSMEKDHIFVVVK